MWHVHVYTNIYGTTYIVDTIKGGGCKVISTNEMDSGGRIQWRAYYQTYRGHDVLLNIGIYIRGGHNV